MLSEESQISNLSTEKQDDADIRCPNCFWYFSSKTKPYILPCFHNLCDKCINNLINQKSPKCPICLKIFTKSDTNQFQVNFAFLNLVTKILANKIIFCKKCYKIFYWVEHSTICNQENFIESDEILNNIKNSCEEGIQIIKLFNQDNYHNTLVKYKNEILSLLSKLILKLRKDNINEIKKVIERIFINNGKERIEFNCREIKKNIINFLLICLDFNEYFNTNEIKRLLYPNFKELTKNGNEILTYRKKHNGKVINLYKSSNITNEIIKIDNNISCENTTKTNNKEISFLLTKTPAKKKFIFENKSSRIYKDKTLNRFGYSPPLSKLKNINNSDNKENNQIENQNKIESEDEVIDNFDDDYHEYGTEMVKEKRKNKTDVNLSPSNFREYNQNKKSKNKDLFEKSLLQDTKTEKKLIIGLNEIKVISLTKKINKSNNEDINKNQIKSNKHIIINKNNNLKNILKKENTMCKNKNICYNTEINNKLIIDNKNKTCKKNTSIQGLNTLFSSADLTKKTEKLILTKNNDDKNIKNKAPQKENECSNNSNCYLNPNIIKQIKTKNKINLKLLTNFKNNNKITYLNHHNNITKRKPVININNINNRGRANNDFILKEKNNKTCNNIDKSLNDKNKSMNKIFNNFNNIKDIIIRINKYLKLTKYINNNINNSISQNLSLLKQNISNDYNLILKDVSNNFCNIQRKYLFSFRNNTKFIILYDTDYNKFIPLDLSDILLKFPNFNSSMQFEFAENNNNFLLFITGGNELFIKDKNDYSSNSFLILNIKINININSKNKINYKKKYAIEFKDKMPSFKSYHSILFYDDNLYVIGGFDNNQKASNECFYFYYKNKEWHDLPKLNIPRGNSSICLYNKSILYLFRGKNNEGQLNTIEYLNLKETDKKIWKIINVVDYGCVWNYVSNSCNVVLEENKILIFGGEDETKLYKESFLFEVKTNNIYRGMDLKIPAAFNGQGIFNNGKIYGFDFKNKNGDYEHKIHIFDIKNNFWTLINVGNNN